MKIKHSNAKPISDEWQKVVDGYLKHLRVRGSPKETIRTRREHLHYLGRTIGLSPSQINSEILIDWCSEQEWAPETRRGRYNTFRQFWRWAAEQGILSDITQTLPKVKQQRGIPRPAPEKIYLEALQRSDDRTRRVLRLAAEYGLRRTEIAKIFLPDDLIQDLRGWTLLVHGKGSKPRYVPLRQGMAEELLSLPPGWAFPSPNGNHLSPVWIGRLAARALDGHWTIHTLRHRFATRGLLKV